MVIQPDNLCFSLIVSQKSNEILTIDLSAINMEDFKNMETTLVFLIRQARMSYEKNPTDLYNFLIILIV